MFVIGKFRRDICKKKNDYKTLGTQVDRWAERQRCLRCQSSRLMLLCPLIRPIITPTFIHIDEDVLSSSFSNWIPTEFRHSACWLANELEKMRRKIERTSSVYRTLTWLLLIAQPKRLTDEIFYALFLTTSFRPLPSVLLVFLFYFLILFSPRALRKNFFSSRRRADECDAPLVFRLPRTDGLFRALGGCQDVAITP